MCELEWILSSKLKLCHIFACLIKNYIYLILIYLSNPLINVMVWINIMEVWKFCSEQKKGVFNKSEMKFNELQSITMMKVFMLTQACLPKGCNDYSHVS